MSTARHVERNHRIAEIEPSSNWHDTTVEDRTPELPRRTRRHDPTVALWLGVSVVFLVVGAATLSIIAWLAGVVFLVAAFSVETRPERELREFRQSRESAHSRRSHRSPAQVGLRPRARPRARGKE